jgi:hypothetical protein
LWADRFLALRFFELVVLDSAALRDFAFAPERLIAVAAGDF